MFPHAWSIVLAVVFANPPVVSAQEQELPPLIVVDTEGGLRARVRQPVGEVRVLPGRSKDLRVEDGVLDFTSPRATLQFGPDEGLAISPRTSFTIDVELRTTVAGFSTAVMSRDPVCFGVVLGRSPGAVSAELWDWNKTRAVSRTRVDDGRWHRVQAAFDAPTRTIILLVDGRVEDVRQSVGGEAGGRPTLWLGSNGGGGQPFPGQMRRFRVLQGVPDAIGAWLRLRSRTTLLTPADTAQGVDQWLDRHRSPRRAKAATAAEWRTEARALRAGVQDALGLWPPPYSPVEPRRLEGTASALSGGPDAVTDFATLRPTLPLAVQRGGELVRDAHKVTRVYWQTFEGYFASGYLYEPKEAGASRSRPAVLCPHGHWQRGAQHPVVQARCITLARLGYVVLAVDAVHVDDDPIGLCSASLMTWNNLRGLELLRGLPDVDPDRIGCTGASGGGQQTMYLSALQTGLAAVAPAVMVSDFETILQASTVHCRCNFTPRVLSFTDQPLMSTAFAPRPQLFLSVTGDWTRTFPTSCLPSVQRIYGLLDAGDRVASRQWPGPHDFSRSMRNAVYAFFGRWLKGESEPGAELEPDALPTEPWTVLRALDRRDVARDPGAVAREFRARLSAPPLTPEQMKGEGAASAVTARRASFARLVGPDPSPAPAAPIELEPMTWRGQRLRRLLVRSEPEIRLPVLALQPPEDVTAVGLVLVVDSAGKSEAFARDAAWLETLLRAGYTVALADVRYYGELDVARTWREPFGKVLGRDPAALAVHDIRRLVEARNAIAGREVTRTVLVAGGECGAPGLLAAALDLRVDAFAAPVLGACYRDRDRRPKLARILRHGDLPDAACLVAPRSLLLAGCDDVARFAVVRARHASSGRVVIRSVAASHADVTAWLGAR